MPKNYSQCFNPLSRGISFGRPAGFPSVVPRDLLRSSYGISFGHLATEAIRSSRWPSGLIAASLGDWLLVFASFDQRIGRVIVNRFEVFRFDDIRADAFFGVTPSRHIANDVFNKLWIVVGAFGHVLLVDAL